MIEMNTSNFVNGLRRCSSLGHNQLSNIFIFNELDAAHLGEREDSLGISPQCGGFVYIFSLEYGVVVETFQDRSFLP